MWTWPEGKKFKPGHRPKHWRPVGAERLVDNGILVKVGKPSKWRLKHLVEWEVAHGPLPMGAKIIFVDGDRFNCSLGNLKLAPREGEKIGGDGFIYVREAEGCKWRRKHLVVWESAFGPVSPRDTILFADGNFHNCELENLIMAPKSLKKRNLCTMQGISLAQEQEDLGELQATNYQLTQALARTLLNLLGLKEKTSEDNYGHYTTNEVCQGDSLGTYRH